MSGVFLLKSKKTSGRNLEADGAPEGQEKRRRQAVQKGSLKFLFFSFSWQLFEKLLIFDRQVVTSFHFNLLGQREVESGFPHFTEGKRKAL